MASLAHGKQYQVNGRVVRRCIGAEALLPVGRDDRDDARPFLSAVEQMGAAFPRRRHQRFVDTSQLVFRGTNYLP
jgi:hypothetical protein